MIEENKSPWQKVLDFNDEFFKGWRTKYNEIYFSNSLAGEAGEVCNATKHRASGGTNTKDIPTEWDVMMELADVYIYFVLMSEKMGMNDEIFSQILDVKIKENVRRKTEERELQAFKETHPFK